jgi:MFS family permease
VVTGVLITAIDTTIVVLALPEIQRTLHIGLASVIWVIIGYLLVITLVSTQVGRLGDMFGRVRMYEAGFVVFIVGSLTCALAWNELSLIVFRLAQGVGGALITANSGAVIADTFPKEQRGRAYGFNSIGFNTGAVLGVILGGIIVTYVSWRWIFWINVPIGIAAVMVANRVLFDRGERQQGRLDWWGMVTLGLGLFGPLWAMVKLTSEPLDTSTIALFAGGLVMLFVFWRIERSTTDPMLDLGLFKVPTMTPSLLAAMFQSLANFAVLFLLLMYVQGVRHLSPIHASLLLVPGCVVGGVVGPFAGRFADRRGAVLPATVGRALRRPPGRRAPGHGGPGDPGDGATRLCPVRSHHAVRDGGDRLHGRSRRGRLLLPEQLGRHEGRTRRRVWHHFRSAAHLRQRRDGLLLRPGHPRGVRVDHESKGLRHLRRHEQPLRLDRCGIHPRHPLRLLLVDGAHGGRGRPLGLASPRRPRRACKNATTEAGVTSVRIDCLWSRRGRTLPGLDIIGLPVDE